MGRPPKHLHQLAPDRDAWEQQPGETDKAFSQFQMYLQLGRKRTLAQAAELLVCNKGWLRDVAAAKLWSDRTAEWDRQNDEKYMHEMAEERARLVKDEAKIASAFLGKIVPRIRRITDADMDRVGPVELGRLVETVMRLMRDAYGVPDKQTTASTVQRDLESSTSGDDADALSDAAKIAQLREWNQEIADFLDVAENHQGIE